MTTPGLHVLLIEDDPADVLYFEEALKEDADYSFALAHAARLEQAFHYLATHVVDLIVLDLSLPESDGLETLQRLLAHTTHLPVVVLTGLDDRHLALQAVQAGAQDYLVKGHTSPAVQLRAMHYAIERHRLHTQAQQYLSELQASEASLRTIIENNADPILLINAQGAVLLANPAAVDLFGWKEGAWQSSVFGIPAIADDVGELEVPRADGSAVFVEFHLSETIWRGEPVYILSFRDITAHKQAAQTTNDFVSLVSHELRTPLTSISGSLALVEAGATGDLPAQARAMIQVAHRNSERLVRLINDLLDLQKIESGIVSLRLKPLELAPLVEQVVEANRAYGQKYDVPFAVTTEAPGVWVSADADRLTQVLTNLLSNAAKFSPAGHPVQVSISRQETTVRVSVRDQGPGIPESDRDRIFKKFTQVDTPGYRPREGTGLGLSISKSLVELHDGRIDFITGSGRGTTFFFDLPIWRNVTKAIPETWDVAA